MTLPRNPSLTRIATPPELRRRWSLGLPLATLVSALMLGTGAGCESGESTNGSSSAASPVAAPAAVGETDLDRYYIVKPAIARELGYRIDWQTSVLPESGIGLRIFTVKDDSVFVLDGQNLLTRIGRDDGARVWRLPIADPTMQIHGIEYLHNPDEVFLMTNGYLMVLDAATGSMVEKQRLGQIAATRPVVYGGYMIYGARNGQLVWHGHDIGHQWRAYQVAHALRIPPLIAGSYVITVGVDGRVMALGARSVSMIWDKKLLDSVTAMPTLDNRNLYVAGHDQHLWAFDLSTGRTRWSHLTESPLTEPPTVLGNNVYQYIPSEGLVCFEADPRDAPEGVINWSAPEAKGNVIGQIRENLVVWDRHDHRLTLVNARYGHVAETHVLPRVDRIMLSRPLDGELFAASEDGSIIRLVPRT